MEKYRSSITAASKLRPSINWMRKWCAEAPPPLPSDAGLSFHWVRGSCCQLRKLQGSPPPPPHPSTIGRFQKKKRSPRSCGISLTRVRLPAFLNREYPYIERMLMKEMSKLLVTHMQILHSPTPHCLLSARGLLIACGPHAHAHADCLLLVVRTHMRTQTAYCLWSARTCAC